MSLPVMLAPVMTSSSALSTMCHIQPDHPVKMGIGKTLGGMAVSIAGGGALGGVGWFVNTMWREHHHDPVGRALLCTMGLIVGGAGIVGGYFGFSWFLDGLTSVLNPVRSKISDGNVYYRNGGYIDHHTASDRKFGSRVFPVEDADQLTQFQGANVFINGLQVQSVSHIAERRSRINLTYSTVTGSSIPNSEFYTQHNLTLTGILKGQKIECRLVTEEDSFAESLARLENGALIYVRGTSDGDNKITDIESFGLAITPRT